MHAHTQTDPFAGIIDVGIMEHVARGMRGLCSAQNELTLGLWTFRGQHLHPGLFHRCVCPQIISSVETECVKYHRYL